jgi:hypothetical protein
MKKIKIIKLFQCIALLACASCSYVDALFEEPPQVSKMVVRTPGSTCTYLDRDNELHSLYACETASSYEVRVLDVSHRYEKLAWQANLRYELRRYGAGQPTLAASLPASMVEVWLAAPPFRPDQAYLVAWIKAPGTSMALRLPLTAESWGLTSKSQMYRPNEGDGYKARVFSFPYLRPVE